MTQCSPLKVNRRFGGKYDLHISFEEQAKRETGMVKVALKALLFFCLDNSSALKMKATCYS
jgi:hypothetical protein